MVDFSQRNDEQYNILCMKADEGTREGLSLYWSEQHIKKRCNSEYKVIIMISDGVPYHTCDEPIDYVPPLSIKDTYEAVKKISDAALQLLP
jgi:nitric oxide reductase activation protein